MKSKMPIRKSEYNLSLSEEEISGQVFIEGYEVMFDKKVTLVPVELIAVVETIITNKIEADGL
jgi:hypothetical protein